MVQFKQYGDQWGNFSALAHETVSGGQFVKAMSVTAPTATGLPDGTIEVMLCNAAADSHKCVGMATNDAASGERVTVASRGLFKTMALGTLVAGEPVACSEDADIPDGVIAAQLWGLGSGVAISLESEFAVGRVLHDAISGEYCFVNVNIGGF